MKRLFFFALVVFGIIWLARHRVERCRTGPMKDAEPAATWAWPQDPLPPRAIETPRREKKSVSIRFAWGDRAVKTTNASAAVVCTEPPESEGECVVQPAPASNPDVRIVSSELMATEDRALRDLHREVKEQVAKWLSDVGVASDWRPPDSLVRAMMQGDPSLGAPIEKEYGTLQATLYQASVPVEFSRARKDRFIQEYHRHVTGQRLGMVGGVLAFVLACLAIVVGYVRGDEATKGYYTIRLRLLAAAGVGVAGVLLYQWIARGV